MHNPMVWWEVYEAQQANEQLHMAYAYAQQALDVVNSIDFGHWSGAAATCAQQDFVECQYAVSNVREEIAHVAFSCAWRHMA